MRYWPWRAALGAPGPVAGTRRWERALHLPERAFTGPWIRRRGRRSVEVLAYGRALALPPGVERGGAVCQDPLVALRIPQVSTTIRSSNAAGGIRLKGEWATRRTTISALRRATSRSISS